MDDGLGMEHPIYECVTPLRVCLLMRERERSWKIVEGLETHREDR